MALDPPSRIYLCICEVCIGDIHRNNLYFIFDELVLQNVGGFSAAIFVLLTLVIECMYNLECCTIGNIFQKKTKN